MCLLEDQSWIDCIDITSRWDTFVLFHLYGNKGVSLPLWPIRPRWFHTFCPCAEPLGDGHEGMWARFGSQGSIVFNWHSRYSGTRYSGTWLYIEFLISRGRQWVNSFLLWLRVPRVRARTKGTLAGTCQLKWISEQKDTLSCHSSHLLCLFKWSNWHERPMLSQSELLCLEICVDHLGN